MVAHDQATCPLSLPSSATRPSSGQRHGIPLKPVALATLLVLGGIAHAQ